MMFSPLSVEEMKQMSSEELLDNIGFENEFIYSPPKCPICGEYLYLEKDDSLGIYLSFCLMCGHNFEILVNKQDSFLGRWI